MVLLPDLLFDDQGLEMRMNKHRGEDWEQNVPSSAPSLPVVITNQSKQVSGGDRSSGA